MACNVYITIKIVELFLCIACIVYKRVSDDEGRRLRIRQEKQNYEWPLLRYITWEQNGSSYADITYGSYVLITTGLLIGYCSGELTKGRNMESFLLGFGALLFIAVGSLELAALDSVPEELIDNAAILGMVSLITGCLFLLDLGLSGKRRKHEMMQLKLKHSGPSKLTQTDEKTVYGGALDLWPSRMSGFLSNGNGKSVEQLDKNDKVVGQLKSSFKGKKGDGETMRVTFPSDILNPRTDFIESSEQNIDRNGITKDSEDYDRNWAKQPERTSQKLRRGDRIPKLPKSTPSALNESEDDSLAIPSVSFIMREKGEFGSQSSLRAKSPSLRSKMLPMMPLEPSNEDPVLRKTKSLDQSLSQPDLGRALKIQRYDNDSEIPHEIVVMSPTEKSEFIAYKQAKKNLAYLPAQVGMFPDDGRNDNNKELKATYSTEEIIEPKPQISPMQSYDPNSSLDTKHRPHLRTSKLERPKGYVEHSRGDMHPRDFSEDISHMSLSERERYLFGESPKQKDSKGGSPDVESHSKKVPSSAQISTSPEADTHWRYDSRDANFGQSSIKSPRDSRESPSSPMDPGYVLHTAHNWPHSTPHSTPKTPSQSPSDIASGTSPKAPYRISSDESDTNTLHQSRNLSEPPNVPPPPPPLTRPVEKKRKNGPSPGSKRKDGVFEEEDDSGPGVSSLNERLLQKWIKQRQTKVTKTKYDS